MAGAPQGDDITVRCGGGVVRAAAVRARIGRLRGNYDDG